ncbi:MAG: hypothetical protein JXB17_03035 [Bacteroidales bacterium]|nr:hypothetical protein [Bacteroidales bacterium]
MNNKILAVTIFSFFIVKLSSQEKLLRFEHIKASDGLAQNTVHGIVKDKYGFIWITTWSGLCRYDGYEFVVYRTKNNDIQSLINNRLKCITKDTNEILWISFFDTDIICRYNYETDNFTRFLKEEVPQKVLNSLNYLFETPKLEVKGDRYTWYIKRWQIDEHECYLGQINNISGKEIIYQHDPLNPWSLNDKFTNYIYLDNQDILWAGTYSGGVNKADTKSKQFIHYFNISQNKNSIIDNHVRAICEDNEGNLWIGTHNRGITKIDRKNDQYVHFQQSNKNNSLISNELRSIYCDYFGYIWLGTKRGLDKFDPITGQFYHYATYLENTIPNDWVFSIIEDKHSILWIGTFKGIAKYDRKNDKFISYGMEITNHNSVRKLMVDNKNNLWIATEGGGITYLKRDTSNSMHENFMPIHYLISQNNINFNRVYCLLEDIDGKIWAGTAGGLVSLNPLNEEIKHYVVNDSLQDELIVGLLSDNNGNIWISHKLGITRFNIKTNTMRHYKESDDLQNTEFTEDAFYKSPTTGEMFFGGVNGFNLFQPDSIKDNPYLPNIVFTELKILNQVVKINQELNGRIVLDKPIHITKEVTLKHCDKIISIEFAALHYSDPQQNQYAYMLEGFDDNWIFTNSSSRVVTYTNLKPKDYFLKVKASNNDGVWNSNPAILKISMLPAWWQTWWFRIIIISIIIALIIFIYYVRVTFYKKRQKELASLINDRTKELEKTNELLLERQTRIEEQTEELEAKTINLKKVNNQLIEKQKLIQIQTKKLKENNKQLKILNSTKDKFFSIIAHDLKNPFNVVSGFSDVLLKKINKFDQEKINKYLEIIQSASTSGNNLLNNLLDWSRSQTGNITFKPKKLNLSNITHDTISLFKGEIHQKNITLNQTIDRKINVIADENMLKTILRNLISNAIKFTPIDGKITISAKPNKSKIEVTIADTGIGIPDDNINLLFRIDTNVTRKGTSNETGTGLGLILCKEFIEKHNGKIWVESQIGVGSKFKFLLPFEN